jgi:predicted hotdog family 3-hydroxylacyl-ACP dehydratase
MCLLDEVLSWDTVHTQCRTSTHRSPNNPLRANGRLGAACGIEYAAQTMAVHGALVSSAAGLRAPQGLLASVRGVHLHIDRLDTIESDLVTRVERVAGDANTALYEFSVSANLPRRAAGASRDFLRFRSGQVVLMSGRAAIAFNVLPGLS